jgi:hypothetical protein
MKPVLKGMYRTCRCGGRVTAVVTYQINKQGVRVTPRREIGHGCDTCLDYKLINIADVLPDEAPQGVLF